jgi:potassium voltage-gated channel Shal-related subfamily D protein 2
VFGLLLIALPSFVLGREFSLVWEEMTRKQVTFSLHHGLSRAHTSYALQNGSLDQPDSPTISRSNAHTIPSQDLSNFKLAQNQTELSKQIEELKTTVLKQGQMMSRLLEVLDGRDKDQAGLS